MTSPVDESTPTIILNDVEKWLDIPPTRLDELANFSNDLPDAQPYHVFQRLKLLSDRFDLHDPFWAEIITEREFVAAAEYYDLERDLARAVMTNTASYAKVIKDGCFARWRKYIENYVPLDIEGTTTDQRSLDTGQPIVVGELHCPHVDGATATFENKQSSSKKLALEVTAAGLGGGGWTRERLHASTSRFSAKAPFCRLVCAHLRGHYVIWEHLDTKQRIVLTNVTGLHGLVDTPFSSVPSLRSSHLCEDNTSYSQLLADLGSGISTTKHLSNSFPLARSPGPIDLFAAEDEWSTSREYSGFWGSEFKIGNAVLKASVTYTSKFVETIKVTENLPRGYHYISRYRSARELPQQWAARRYP